MGPRAPAPAGAPPENVKQDARDAAPVRRATGPATLVVLALLLPGCALQADAPACAPGPDTPAQAYTGAQVRAFSRVAEGVALDEATLAAAYDLVAATILTPGGRPFASAQGTLVPDPTLHPDAYRFHLEADGASFGDAWRDHAGSVHLVAANGTARGGVYHTEDGVRYAVPLPFLLEAGRIADDSPLSSWKLDGRSPGSGRWDPDLPGCVDVTFDVRGWEPDCVGKSCSSGCCAPSPPHLLRIDLGTREVVSHVEGTFPPVVLPPEAMA